MSLTYDSFVSNLANITVCSTNDQNYLNAIPNILDDAHQRIYRELDFLNTVTVSTATLMANTRTVSIPSSIVYVVVDRVNYVDANNSRTPLTRVTPDFIDMVYPTATSSSSAATPIYFGMLTDQQAVFGPPPANTASLEIVGTARPAVLSSANTPTYLSLYYPDLLMAASLVFANGYLKNFSQAADDPQAPVTWETHYQKLKESAMQEEQRKKGRSEGWTAEQPSPNAQRKS